MPFPEGSDSIRGCGSYVFGCPRSGILEHVADKERVEKKVPNLVDLYIAVKQGERVSRFEHNGNLISCAVLDCDGSGNYAQTAGRIHKALSISVIP